MRVLQPKDATEAAETILWAASQRKALEIRAGGSKSALGRPVRADALLDVSRLAGVVEYEPAELVLTARPGTPLKEIEALLAGNGQMLSFEPPDWRGLLGTESEPTLGGALACNLSGPRRLRAGAARDYFLGFSAINGRGESFKAGGKVVKNVTGYDLCKLMAGSFGTLALLTEVTIKVMPRPETACTLLLHGLSDENAIPLIAGALNSPHEISGAAHLPTAAAQRLGFAESAADRAAAGRSGAVDRIPRRGSGQRLRLAARGWTPRKPRRSGARSATWPAAAASRARASGGSARRRARRRR